MRNETEMLLQVWADVLRDVQADKDFMQQTEREAQGAAFRVRAEAVRGEVLRRLQKVGALPGTCAREEAARLMDAPRVDRAEPSGNDYIVDRPRQHKRKNGA